MKYEQSFLWKVQAAFWLCWKTRFTTSQKVVRQILRSFDTELFFTDGKSNITAKKAVLGEIQSWEE